MKHGVLEKIKSANNNKEIISFQLSKRLSSSNPNKQIMLPDNLKNWPNFLLVSEIIAKLNRHLDIINEKPINLIGQVIQILDPNHFILQDRQYTLHCHSQQILDGLQVGQTMVAQGSINLIWHRHTYEFTVYNYTIVDTQKLIENITQAKQQLINSGLTKDITKKVPHLFCNNLIVMLDAKSGLAKSILAYLNLRAPCKIKFFYVNMQKIKSLLNGINYVKNALKSHKDSLLIADNCMSLQKFCSFNNFAVAKALKELKCLVVSALGHHSKENTYNTLTDQVADLNCSNYVEAIRLIQPPKNILKTHLNRLFSKIYFNTTSLLDNLNFTLERAVLNLDKFNLLLAYYKNLYIKIWHRISLKLQKSLQPKLLKLYLIERRFPLLYSLYNFNFNNFFTTALCLKKHFSTFIRENLSHLANLNLLLESYNYNNSLTRGFAYITDSYNCKIINSQQILKNTTVLIHFSDGVRNAVIYPLGSAPKRALTSVGRQKGLWD